MGQVVEDKDLQNIAEKLAVELRQRGQRLAAAESCTGGWISKVVTDLPGSSDWFDRGFVTYSNTSKIDMLGVTAESLQRHGAVSESVVMEMALGALHNSTADYAVAVSGIAGPGGGTENKPVGTVWFAWAGPAGIAVAVSRCFDGDRDAVRRQAVATALQGVLESLD